MFQYFSKSKGQCSQAMKKAAKEAFDNNMNHHDTKETIAKVYLSNRKCFVQQVVYHIFSRIEEKKNLSSCVFC